jgi:ribonucleoside-diphosphate reductase alpha chain
MMRVLKRNNRGYEDVKFDKITDRIRILCNGLDDSLNPVKIAIQTITSIYDGISTEQLDFISANIAESYKIIHPDYSKLASRLLVSNLHKSTPKNFSDCMHILQTENQILDHEYYKFIMYH